MHALVFVAAQIFGYAQVLFQSGVSADAFGLLDHIEMNQCMSGNVKFQAYYHPHPISNRFIDR
jgi:hypothetical protein